MPRFVKIGADGAKLPARAKNHVAVLDTVTNLMWSAEDISPNALTWKDAKSAAKKLRLAGEKGWRLPTVEELFLLANRSKFKPAIDTAFFPSCKSDWYWTSSPDASDPSDYAWVVGFSGGYAHLGNQHCPAFVRAVRSVSAPSGQ